MQEHRHQSGSCKNNCSCAARSLQEQAMVSPGVNCKYMVSPIGKKGWELHILEGLQRPFQMWILLANESTHLQKVRTQRKSTILSFLEREQTAILRSLTGSLLYYRTWCWVLSSRAIFRRPLSYPLRPFEILSCLD